MGLVILRYVRFVHFVPIPSSCCYSVETLEVRSGHFVTDASFILAEGEVKNGIFRACYQVCRSGYLYHFVAHGFDVSHANLVH